jgi:hypothetical protein
MTYQTDNIAVAGALRTLGHTITNITVDGRRATFYFNSDAIDVAHDIQIGSQLVDAISFHQELRRLSGLAKSMSQNKD